MAGEMMCSRVPLLSPLPLSGRGEQYVAKLVTTAPRNTRLLHAALVMVWLATALVSLLDWQEVGTRLLRSGGIQSPVWTQVLIVGGALADLCVGLWLLMWPGRRAWQAALTLMLLMTVTATWLLPALWLDPLGALLKNLPIAAILLFLLQEDNHLKTTRTA